MSRTARRSPLAIVLTVAVAAVGLALAPIGISAASASTTSDLKAQIIKDLDSWRVHQEDGHNAKQYSGLNDFLQAEAEYHVDGSPTATLFSQVPTGYTNSSVFDQYVTSASGSVSAVASAIAAQLEADDTDGNLAHDNYAGVGLTKTGSRWLADVGAWQYDSGWESRSATAHVTVSGSDRVGGTLTAHSSVHASAKTDVTFAWFVGYFPAGYAATYTVQDIDLGAPIFALVVVTTEGKSPKATILRLHSVEHGTLNTSSVTVTGHHEVGEELTLHTGTWGPDGVTLAYQWYRGSSKIADATATTYTQVPADYGHRITARVTGTLDAYNTAYRQSPSGSHTANPSLTNSVAPSITGTLAVGQTLTAAPGTWSPGTPTFTYQWRIGSTAVKGATHSTFVVPSKASGHTVRVTVTAHESGYAGTELTAITDTITVG